MLVKFKIPLQERSLERKFKRAIEARKLICIKLNPAHQKGIPDRMVLLPGNRHLIVELKSTDGGLSPHQLDWIQKLEKLQNDTYVLYTEKDLENFLVICDTYLI